MKYVVGILATMMVLSAGAYATDAVRVDKNGLVTISAMVPSPIRFMLSGGQDSDGGYHQLRMDKDGRVLCAMDDDRNDRR